MHLLGEEFSFSSSFFLQRILRLETFLEFQLFQLKGASWLFVGVDLDQIKTKCHVQCQHLSYPQNLELLWCYFWKSATLNQSWQTHFINIWHVKRHHSSSKREVDCLPVWKLDQFPSSPRRRQGPDVTRWGGSQPRPPSRRCRRAAVSRSANHRPFGHSAERAAPGGQLHSSKKESTLVVDVPTLPMSISSW